MIVMHKETGEIFEFFVVWSTIKQNVSCYDKNGTYCIFLKNNLEIVGWL